jgi:hypothetical protein
LDVEEPESLGNSMIAFLYFDPYDLKYILKMLMGMVNQCLSIEFLLVRVQNLVDACGEILVTLYDQGVKVECLN